MVCQNHWEFNQWVLSSFVHKHIWEWALAYFALELTDVDAGEVIIVLAIFFSFEPAFEAHVMDVFYSTSTRTYLKQRVVRIKLSVPAKPTLWSIITLDHWFLLAFFVFFKFNFWIWFLKLLEFLGLVCVLIYKWVPRANRCFICTFSIDNWFEIG